MPQGKVSSSTVESRRSLFRRLAGRHETAIRPPWAVAEAAFIDRCDRCGACADACEDGLIGFVRGYPEMSFHSGGCTFCGACVRVCARGALDAAALAAGRRPWALAARIGEACLSAAGVVCRVCGEQCEAGAIRFRLAPGGRSRPEVGPGCTGCGACVAPCPVAAVGMTADARGRLEEQCA